MRENKRLEPPRSQITRQILFRYTFSLVGFMLAVVVLVFVSWWICRQFVWQRYDPLYRLLRVIEAQLLPLVGIILFAGWTGITYHFIAKPLAYLDEIVAASERLAAPDVEAIVLPEALKSVQDELNLVRETALRNSLLAKEAEQRKNDLIVYLAHDLKTPLTSVIGYLTLLQDEPQISTELRARYTGIALDKAERLEDLIDEFFDITRFNLTTLTLELEHTNLSRMLEQLTHEFTPILAEKELRWHTEIESDVCILCDPDKLGRVFDNHIRNAVNYSYPQTELFLSMCKIEDQVEVLVKNRGKTIPPDKLARVFEQFFRLDPSRASATGGAGLGLAISKEIVELHHGSIKAESADESITFTILLPVDCQKIARISSG
jgi:two-component system, OmpR family, sensor histidine kinase VanS